MHSVRRRLYLLNKRILFDEYSLHYSIGIICNKFPSMDRKRLIEKFQKVVKPKIDACRFCRSFWLVKTLANQEDADVNYFGIQENNQIDLNSLILDSSYDNLLLKFPGKTSFLEKYSEIYFMDYAESLEMNKNQILGKIDNSRKVSVTNVIFYDWRKRESSNGHSNEGFQLFDDTRLQCLLSLSPELSPLTKYRVNSTDVPSSEELTSWFGTMDVGG